MITVIGSIAVPAASGLNPADHLQLEDDEHEVHAERPVDEQGDDVGGR